MADGTVGARALGASVLPRVLSVRTRPAPHVLAQEDATGFARRFFADDFPHLERLLGAFGNTGIGTRQLARPLQWYASPRTFPEKNAVYCESARALSTAAARDALDAAGVEPEAVDAVVFVSSTGIATPSLDGRLVQDLGLRRDVSRVPIWGLGCAGGASGLARAADLALARGGPVLLVAVEICSVTFVHDDRSKSNLIATALFGDGAAAAVVAPCRDAEGPPGPTLIGSHSRLLDDSEDVMGWTLDTGGLRVRFARSIPAIVHEVVPSFTRELAEAVGLEDGFDEYVVHPGGAKVLQAYVDALGLDPAALDTGAQVLAQHGNMSSPTVLFALERFLEETPATGRAGMLIGLGPGFSAEGVAFRW